MFKLEMDNTKYHHQESFALHGCQGICILMLILGRHVFKSIAVEVWASKIGNN